MRKILTCSFAIFSILFASKNNSFAQLNVTVTITDAVVNTTCNDIFSDPDEAATVIINGEAPVTYESGSNCYPAFPNLQYQATYVCGDAIPPTIQVCFQAFENDPSPFGDPCEVIPDCLVELCGDFPIPPQGDALYVLEIPAGGDSDGTLSFTINSTGLPGALNDLPCDAIDAGVLDFGQGMGDLENSVFNNFCATSDNEPNDFNTVGFFNNNGVWVKFTTSSTPGAVHKITGVNDPSMLGDNVSLQIGLFENENNDCMDLTPLFGGSALNGSDFDEFLTGYCLKPDTEYFILIDGDALTGGANSDSLFGYFGFEVRDLGAISGPDFICDAEDLGTVPDGGSVTSPLISNGCGTSTGDPNVSGLFNSKGVFVKFQPPATGNVTIDVISDPNGDDEMNVEFAVLASPNGGDCNGPFTKIDVQSFSANMNESTTLPCLDPTQTYWLLVDGQGASSTRSGIFEVTITDEGENTPVFDQVVALCAGDDLVVGTSVYDETGMYSDTIILQNGCDSIVNTDLTILPEVEIFITINQPGIGEGMPNGIATAAATGGSGNGYTYVWSNGETGSMVDNLIGEQEYCVTVTDDNGCMDDTCFVQPLVINLVPITPNDSLDCNGDTDGILSISAFAGLPPYMFSWQNADNSLNGNGVLNADFEEEVFTDLPAGLYSVQINDSNFDTTVVVQIWEPEPITLDQENITNNSCFNACDGIINVNISGGTPPYLTDWSNGVNGTEMIDNLCAGNYTLIVADANNCVATFDFTVTEPDELQVNGVEVQAVSCFQGDDGVASVTVANGNNVAYLWDNGETTQVISNLVGGVYEVTITNEDGCTAVSSATVTTPNAPLAVSIQEIAPIICGGSNEGILEATTTGPGNSITYEWNSQASGPFLDELFAGTYSVTVTNENGCTAMASFNLNEPPEIFAETSVMSVSCYGGLTDGVIFIDNVTGGVPPYSYSSTGFGFTDIPELEGLTAGLQTLFVKDDLGCVRPFEVSIPDVPDVSVNLGPDLVLDLGDSIRLNAMTVVGNLTYTWETNQLLSCFDCQKPTIKPRGNTTIKVTVFDEESGCEESDELFIEVVKKRKFYMANAFSPNNDGSNDIFFLQSGSDVELVKSFMIFDRNGAQVFVRNNVLPNDTSNGWDGSFNGKNMDSGVFAWFAEVLFLDGTVEVYSGDVTLVK